MKSYDISRLQTNVMQWFSCYVWTCPSAAHGMTARAVIPIKLSTFGKMTRSEFKKQTNNIISVKTSINHTHLHQENINTPVFIAVIKFKHSPAKRQKWKEFSGAHFMRWRNVIYLFTRHTHHRKICEQIKTNALNLIWMLNVKCGHPHVITIDLNFIHLFFFHKTINYQHGLPWWVRSQHLFSRTSHKINKCRAAADKDDLPHFWGFRFSRQRSNMYLWIPRAPEWTRQNFQITTSACVNVCQA